MEHKTHPNTPAPVRLTPKGLAAVQQLLKEQRK